MGQKNSAQKQVGRARSPHSVCKELNSSNSSIYSNYEDLRKVQQEEGCYVKYKKPCPPWVRYYRKKCTQLAPSQLPWAEAGVTLIEIEGTKDFYSEYINLFEKKIKESKQIIAGRHSIQKEPDMDNLLKDLDETMQQPAQDFYSKPNQEEDNYYAQQADGEKGNTSFPSYMVDNQFQGLRAGNVTMLNMQDTEGYKRNLMIYFECTNLLSNHIDNTNFTLNNIRESFLNCYYPRYTKQLKELKKKKQQEQEEKQKRGISEKNEYAQSICSLDAPKQQIQASPLPQNGLDNNSGTNGSACRLGINIIDFKGNQEGQFSPSKEAVKIYQNALSEFEFFVTIFMETLKQYYDIHYRKKQNVNPTLKEFFCYRNFQNFIISKLFKNKQIPKMLLELIKLVTFDDIKLIESASQNISPLAFGVPPEFCLNEDTIKYLQKNNGISNHVQALANQNQAGKVQNKNEGDEEEMDSDEDQDLVFELKVNQENQNVLPQYRQSGTRNYSISASSASQENFEPLNLKENIIQVESFERCIECIKKLESSTTPTGKFKQIILACEGIEKCVSSFYKKQGLTMKKALDEESIIAILTYIIYVSKIPHLEAHCKFVQAFYKSPTKKLKLRYYLLAFETSVHNVLELLSQPELLIYDSQNSSGDNQSDISLNCTARSIYHKNISKKLSETFGKQTNPRILANITGRNSLLKQTLAEVKSLEIMS